MKHLATPFIHLAVLAAAVSLTLSPHLSLSSSQAALETPQMHPGFPRTEIKTVDFSSPAAVDLDQDHDLEILVGDGGGCVWAFDSNGAVLPNFPIMAYGSCSSGRRISGPLAVGNLDGDGDLEIVAGTEGIGDEPGQRGEVFAWNRDGSLLPGWPAEMEWNTEFGNGRPEVYTVALANVNGGSGLEIIAGTSNNASAGGTEHDNTHNLYAYQADGSVLNGFPTMWKRAGIYGLIAAGDVNHDGCDEIIAGRDHRWLHIYKPNGQNPEGWPQETFIDPQDKGGPYVEFTRNAPVLGDINGDGLVDIVASGRVKNDGVVSNSAVMVFSRGGSRPDGWSIPRLGDGPPLINSFDPSQAPALADLDSDGKLEIIVALTDGSLRAYSSRGDLIWKFGLDNTPHVYFSEPVVGDITGDGELDIVFGAYSPNGSANDKAGVYALNASGALISGYPLTLSNEGREKFGIRAAPTLADMDGDSKVEIIAASWGGALYVWDVEAAYHPDRMPWPTGRANNQRSAYGNPSPYRVLGQLETQAEREEGFTTFLPFVLSSSDIEPFVSSCP